MPSVPRATLTDSLADRQRQGEGENDQRDADDHRRWNIDQRFDIPAHVQTGD
jgi:hypothetical protein